MTCSQIQEFPTIESFKPLDDPPRRRLVETETNRDEERKKTPESPPSRDQPRHIPSHSEDSTPYGARYPSKKFLRHNRQPLLPESLAYFMSSSFKSNIRVLFAGIFPMARLPYAMLGGTVNRRSPMAAIPTTPTSQPLITSPLPSLKVKGGPFLFAVWHHLVSLPALKVVCSLKTKTHHQTPCRFQACQCTSCSLCRLS